MLTVRKPHKTRKRCGWCKRTQPRPGDMSQLFMTKTALFIRHQAQPGKRDDVRRVWEKFVKPRATANPAHEAYYFCYDSNDADAICVFQLYTSAKAMQNFLKGDWYADYLKEVGEFVAVPPQITPADLVWAKSVD